MFDPSYASCDASPEMTIKVPEKTIRDDEILGRSVFSGSAARRADKGHIVRDVFLVRLDAFPWAAWTMRLSKR